MKTIRQTVTFDATPDQIYEALMDSKKHSEFTGSKAAIENKKGGKFEVWDGYANGINLELIPGKKIVQTWRASDWPEGVESNITYMLRGTTDKTELEFTQTGVPDEFYDDISRGWEEYYWQPLNKFLQNT